MNDYFTDFYYPPFDPAHFTNVADAPGVIVLYDGSLPIYLAATSSLRYWLRAHWAERNNPTEDAELWEYVCFYLSDIRFAVKPCENPAELAAQLLPDLCPRFNFPPLPWPHITSSEELGNELLLARAELSDKAFLLFCDLAMGSLKDQRPSMKELYQMLGSPDAETFRILLREVRTHAMARERAQLDVEEGED